MNKYTTYPVRGQRATWQEPFFGDVLSRVFGDSAFTDHDAVEKIVSPRTDIYESEQAFTLTVDLPGVNKSAISVDLTDGVLSIAAGREQAKLPDTTSARQQERFSGRYQRQFSVGELVDEDAITAQYTDGILTLTLPKRAEETPTARRIEIH